jgi:hypothetical protein
VEVGDRRRQHQHVRLDVGGAQRDVGAADEALEVARALLEH